MHDDLFSFLDGPPATFEFAHIDGFGRTDRAHDASATRPSWFDCRIVGSQTKQRTPASVPRRIVRWPDGIRHAAMRTRNHRTQPIVVAVRNVVKGTAITREDVELREAPSDGSLSNAFHTLDDAVGLIAQVGIGAHDVLMSGMARASPVVPQGHTSIEVRLASVAGGLIPGDKVTLSSATMTDAEIQSGTPNVADMPNSTETPSGMANDMPDGGVDAQLRTICAEALLTGKPAKDAQGNTIAVFAMPPNEAAVVLRVQEYSAVIATIN